MIAGAELGEHPYSPITPESIRRAAELGDELPVAWKHRSERYTEKLATPDTSVADLVGDVDPIKVAEGRTLGDPETIAYGLIPRAHRGIVAVNELPDLAERIQVSMLNVMEERDIQVRGYTLRLPLDVLVVASANPRTTPTAAGSSLRSKTASAPRSAPTTRSSWKPRWASSSKKHT
ncbi:sigma-54 interaction domain protein [Mycobacterium xenopi 3993]|nr:sigma-54 interaction domain protein [Mycobacterium xenopi 3993]